MTGVDNWTLRQNGFVIIKDGSSGNIGKYQAQHWQESFSLNSRESNDHFFASMAQHFSEHASYADVLREACNCSLRCFKSTSLRSAALNISNILVALYWRR
jgi:hypothetical protein